MSTIPYVRVRIYIYIYIYIYIRVYIFNMSLLRYSILHFSPLPPLVLWKRWLIQKVCNCCSFLVLILRFIAIIIQTINFIFLSPWHSLQCWCTRKITRTNPRFSLRYNFRERKRNSHSSLPILPNVPIPTSTHKSHQTKLTKIKSWCLRYFFFLQMLAQTFSF